MSGSLTAVFDWVLFREFEAFFTTEDAYAVGATLRERFKERNEGSELGCNCLKRSFLSFETMVYCLPLVFGFHNFGVT
jgi:hypothetical protein